MTDNFESWARRGKLAQVIEAMSRDQNWVASRASLTRDRAAQVGPAIEILERFRTHRDATALKEELGHWGRGPGFQAYGGVNGQMFLNQLVNYAADPDELALVLDECLRTPGTVEEAKARIRTLASFAESVKRGAHPAPRRAIFFLSFFWSLQDPRNWPCFWPSAEKLLVRLGWLEQLVDLGDLYGAFVETVLDLGDPDQVESAMYWMDEHPMVGLHPSILERCAQNLAAFNALRDGVYASPEDELRSARNARAILGELAVLGDALTDDVAQALGRTAKMETPSVFANGKIYRTEGWVRWSVTGEGGAPAASFRVWVTDAGVFLGLHPGHYRNGWYSEAVDLFKSSPPPGARAFPLRFSDSRVDPSPDPTWRGESLLGWHYPAIEQSSSKLGEEIVRRAADLQPMLDRLVAHAGGRPAQKLGVVDPLLKLADQFIAERPYPTSRDESDRADREVMAASLASDEIRVMDIADLRKVYSSNRYGSPGPQSVLSVTLRDATPVELQEYLDRLHFLLWGDGDDAARINAMLDPNGRWIKGLGEAGIMKLLSVVHPDRYIPVYPYAGDNGKVRLMKALGLTPPSDTLSVGERHVKANDLLRERLDPLFPNDPWGQAQFAYWLAQRPVVEAEESVTDVLATLADDLLVSRGFVDEVVDLLREKGQVIFYGPPGTGKTWVARALAKALAVDPTRSAIVQFHPSTSYEDFFEGFRPEESGGQLSYQLRKGPLALMAEKAEASPGIPHVMVIDELNRANLPKVFGELLFLLEYRDEQVRTIYRPDDAFSLPKNLWFIGTMNTADRSIALVDAALRRRFHFIPFFPDDGEMEGLLHRWLDREKQPTWIADLVEMVNSELVDELGGPDLQIGPSYFMKAGVEAALPKIWKYNVEPLIQDQLFGQSDKIKAFGFDQVMKRFAALGTGAIGVDPDE